jgi:hypothetical protein
MVHLIKNIKTKLPPLRINIRFWGRLAGIIAVIGLLCYGNSGFATFLGFYLGYKALRLAMTLFVQVLSIIFTVLAILILVVIISFLII